MTATLDMMTHLMKAVQIIEVYKKGYPFWKGVERYSKSISRRIDNFSYERELYNSVFLSMVFLNSTLWLLCEF